MLLWGLPFKYISRVIFSPAFLVPSPFSFYFSFVVSLSLFHLRFLPFSINFSAFLFILVFFLFLFLSYNRSHLISFIYLSINSLLIHLFICLLILQLAFLSPSLLYLHIYFFLSFFAFFSSPAPLLSLPFSPLPSPTFFSVPLHSALLFKTFSFPLLHILSYSSFPFPSLPSSFLLSPYFFLPFSLSLSTSYSWSFLKFLSKSISVNLLNDP